MARTATARRATEAIPWATLPLAQEGMTLHSQITALLTRQMEQGQLRPGDVLPPEVDLARQLGVSRQTLRAGLDALVRAGRLERRRGSGTVVRRPPIELNLARIYSLAEELRLHGTDLQTQVLARGRLAAEDELAARACDQLGQSEPQQIGYLLRLRLVEGTPVFLETITFPVEVAPYLLDTPDPGKADVGAAPFYATIQQRSQLEVTRARETFRPLLATGYEARLLGVPGGTAVFEVERLSFAHERLVEWRRTLARGDRYVYAVDLVNPSEEEC